MNIVNAESHEELQHFGILGMKWGKRGISAISNKLKEHKKNESDYKSKLDAITKNKSAHSSDIKRAKYRQQSYAMRFTKTAGSFIAGKVVRDMLIGDVIRYGRMSKKQLLKEAKSIAIRSAASVAIQDGLARSASNKYTDKGRKVKGRKNELITREDAMEIGGKLAVQLAAVGTFMGATKLSKIARTRKANRERFEKWGSRILPEKVDNVVWQSNDLKTSVIDNRRR